MKIKNSLLRLDRICTPARLGAPGCPGQSRLVAIRPAILVSGLLAAFAVGGCGPGGDGKQPQAEANARSTAGAEEYVAPDANGIQTITAQSTVIPEYLELPAHIEADPTRVVHVFAPVGGRIMEMKVRPWDRVEKGQTLAMLESSDLARTVADYRKALVDSQVKQQQLTRSEELLAHHAISEREYQQTQADAEQAKAEVAATREQVQVFGMDPDHASTQLFVAAPGPGVILDIGAAQGEFSQALSAPAPLCTIADITTVWAVGDIYEKDLAAAKSGQQAQISLNAYPNEHWTGRVNVVSAAVDLATRTLHVRVVLPNAAARIKPGMFGTIRLLRSSTRGILVPASSVLREGNNAYIFVGEGSGRFERRSVKLGREFDGSLEIVSGANAGDTIVSEGALLLRSAGQG
jgi:cobalt-zinc-cadmium efflux system membrane fusion protein